MDPLFPRVDVKKYESMGFGSHETLMLVVARQE